MRKFVFTLSMIVLTQSLFSQDTIFYNKSWVKTTKDSASYYRIYSDTANFFKVADYYITGISKMTGYSHSKDSIMKFGRFNYYFDDGAIHSMNNYINNRLDGKSVYYYQNGTFSYEINFIEDKKNGELKGYYENGALRRVDHYKNGLLLDGGKCFTQTGQDTTYFIYERNASFKNGTLEVFRDFVLTHLKYPPEAMEMGIQGKVIIQFVVNSKGKVSDIKVLKSPNMFLNRAAIEAVSKSDLWEPGIQEGKKVKQQFTIPINFKL